MSYKILGTSINFPKGKRFTLWVVPSLIEDPQKPRVANDYEFPEDEKDPNWKPSHQGEIREEAVQKTKEESVKDLLSGAKDFLKKL